jgi:indolepyruvate ferredoxin oxidoreductase beta subunit
LNPNNYTIVITGLGGQGLIQLLKILGNALMISGYEVITSETHGLSQRGGKVTCFLRFGKNLNGPIPMTRTADMIIALEESTIMDVLKFAKPDKTTILIVSTYEKHILGIEYPSIQTLLNRLYENSDNFYLIPAIQLAEKQTSNQKTMNSVILGYITKFLNLNHVILEESIKEHFTGKVLVQNLKAFHEGLNL